MTEPRHSQDARPGIGSTVGRWTVHSLLGSGAFGQTWRASRDDGAVAALKVVRTPPGAELRTLAQLFHPAIPALLEASAAAPWFLAVELAPGRPLTEVFEGGGVDEEPWLRGMGGLFDALALVHAARCKHGDVTPANILWSPEEPVPAKLVDFGLSEGSGGTPLWLSPEQVRGEAPGPASDVYALALVTWRGLFGQLPHAHLAPDEALSRRSCVAPAPPTEAGPAWLRALLVRALAPDPADRPTAAAMADAFEAHGHATIATGTSLFRRRAAAVRIRRRALDGALARWMRRPGPLVVMGPPGSGRGLLADQVGLDLMAAGRSFVRLLPGPAPWSGVFGALEALGQVLPWAADDVDRVDRVVALLEGGEEALLVHRYDEHDPWTRQVVDQLAQRGRAVLATAAVRPSWGVGALSLEPLDGDQIGALLAALLGRASDCAPTRRAVWRATRGLAGDVVRFVVASVEQGALRRRHGAWVFDEGQAVVIPPRDASALDVEPGSTAARVLSALGWLGCPVAPEALAGLLDLDPGVALEAIAVLTARGGVRMQGREVVLERGMLDLARQRSARPPFGAEEGAALVRRTHPRALEALAWLALASGDRVSIERDGLDALRWWTARCPAQVVDLAAALTDRCPTGALVEARLRLLVAAGRVAEARAVGTQALGTPESPEPRPGFGGAMVVMAELENNHGGQPEVALAWCARAVGGGPEHGGVELALARARALSLLGDEQTARDCVLPHAHAPMPADCGALRLWLRARTAAAQSIHHLGDLPAAIELLQSVPEDAGHGLAERAVAHAALGRLFWFAGQFRAADDAMTRAGAEGTGLPMLDRARLLNNLGAVRHHSGNRAEAVSAWEQALGLFELVESTVEAVRTRANLCVGYKELGRYERARQAGVESARGAAELDAPDLRCHAALNLGELSLCLGRWADAEDQFTDALALADGAGLARETVEARLRLLELGLRRGDVRLTGRADAIQADAAGAGMLVEQCQASALGAWAAARQGASCAVVDTLVAAAVRPLQEAGAAADLARVRLWVAEAHLALDRPEAAATELDRARSFAREHDNVPLQQQAESLAERLAARWDDPGRDRRLEKLVSVAVAINEQADLRDVFDQVARAARALLDCERAFVLTGDPPVVVAAVTGGVAQGRPSMSVVEKAMRQRRPVIAADVGERGDLRAVRSVAAMELRSVMCVPMQHHAEVIGAIYVDSRSAGQHAMWESAELMRGLAALAAVAVVKMRYFEESVHQAALAAELAERERAAAALAQKNAELERLNHELRQSAITDPLTGIGNRRHMATTLSDAFATAQGGGPALSVVIADIDHFKRINDTWGHQTGDRVIAEVAHRLQSALRGEDRVFRFGGEEMVVLTRALDEDCLRALCERLRCAIAEDPFALGDDRTGQVTASFGASTMCLDTDTRWEEILQRADAALYAAKAGGRNRVVLHQDEATEAVA